MSESRGPKNDKLDAFGLAEQLRIGAIRTKVYKKRGRFARLGYRAKAHALLVADSVRVQSRIKALLRSRGVATAGVDVYSTSERDEWLLKLPQSARSLAELLYLEYDGVEDKHGTPQRVFLGCPHMTYGQMTEWGKRIVDAMEKAGKKKIGVPAYMFGSQYVKDAFEKRNPEVAKKLKQFGVSIPINCPMMWCSTPIEGAELVATNSSKTRVYTTARFFFDDALTELTVTGKLPADVA